ncbi:expressed unknown protein [Ectocarpus siliculosus]|uniref:Uncharacterized protein n=1 Tax=Ectocarpus siliculosus TaxID=2880 RepID=D7G1J9_ECTSI|nr:expressed unknown protein [Ectocarpus siliculosus]|eukprot:CBJ26807.1 expressed unknown protein [Ectocarpus siliculosus]
MPRTANTASASRKGGGVVVRVSATVKAGSLFLLLLLAGWTFPATAAIQPYTLEVRTRNATNAGSLDEVHLSFCDGGGDDCVMGPENVYNSMAELAEIGTRATFEIPLAYEPTAMSISIVGIDAWCFDEAIWNGGTNLLGSGARVYLDGDLGEKGCNYGVHFDTGWFYPCQSRWRFFNLPGSDDYEYEIKVKPCDSATPSGSASLSQQEEEAAAVRESSASTKILASLCSESECDETAGEVVNVTLAAEPAQGGGGGGGTSGAGGGGDWATTRTPATFNPVAMRLTNVGDLPWCAEEVAFNEYTLVNRYASPHGMKLDVGDDRLFFNVQSLGLLAGDSSDDPGGSDDDYIKGEAWELAREVITAVLVFTATVAVTSVVRRCTHRPSPNEAIQGGNDDDGDENSDDDDFCVEDGAAIAAPLVRTACSTAQTGGGDDEERRTARRHRAENRWEGLLPSLRDEPGAVRGDGLESNSSGRLEDSTAVGVSTETDRNQCGGHDEWAPLCYQQRQPRRALLPDRARINRNDRTRVLAPPRAESAETIVDVDEYRFYPKKPTPV